MSQDRARFSLTHYPLPKNAQGKTFYDQSASFARLRRAFRQTVEDRTVGVLWGDPGVGKTTAIRNLIAELPRPDYQVLYLCNTSGSPLDLYRARRRSVQDAGEIGGPYCGRRRRRGADAARGARASRRACGGQRGAGGDQARRPHVARARSRAEHELRPPEGERAGT